MDDGYGANRAVKEIAALHDAVRAVLTAGRGELRSLAAETERLGMLLVQSYNHLLGLAVAADRQHGTRLRFDVVQGFEPYDRELADAGIKRNGEGGLSLQVAILAQALRDRPSASARSLREAAGACACLSGWLSRHLAGLTQAPPGPDFKLTPPAASKPLALEAAAQAEPQTPGPTVRVFNFETQPHGEGPGGRPTFYA